ncbi:MULTISPECIES: phosphatase PAP2 family protein [Bacillaceae]|uniref:Phosphatase PAP2 family protein n=1 Tax=Evansella alkalicola TaxID=745819 RepID=A0ABS6JSJ6_9BACI|nr:MULTISPECIES: phosphatase PAP2 family protein [Bacillaceae]MBU9720135.1 phosphatase PAP2 family protein [Bacillus alkalicola]
MSTSTKKDFYIAISFLVLFVFLSVLSLLDQLVLFDQRLISLAMSVATPSIMSAMELITKIGSGEIIIVLTVLIGITLMVKKMWAYTILLFTLNFGGIILNFLLKILFQRERPGEMSVIEVFGYSLEISSYSFPSGHTMRVSILFILIIFLSFQLISNTIAKYIIALSAIFVICAIALSRIIVGAHFPSDIFAAIAISISWSYLCFMTFRHLTQGRFSRSRALWFMN